MRYLTLDKKKILKIQQNRDPYLMIDHVSKVIPGVSAKGYKILKSKEWFFDVHWPGDPNMPGMLQIEALVQMSAIIIQTLKGNEGKILYLVSANNLKFYKKIVPKKKFKIQSILINDNRGIFSFKAEGFVDNKLSCKADISLIIPSAFNIKVNKKY